MPLHISTLVNNTNNFDPIRLDFVKHRMPALWKTSITGFHFVSPSSKQGICGQFVETGKYLRQIAFRLIDSPLLQRKVPDRFKIAAGKGA